jgi:hypothetical protein
MRSDGLMPNLKVTGARAAAPEAKRPACRASG